ncbi:uncharacterized protein LOC123398229 [Hordeum vulgare subsp. vulgare]|uniref:Uncharacterized protein n=1 Tax=Hordeum vulgare subsp. vulgare TaxID=112509 RepID=A0A8I6XQG4_HORVV|nr:uncharacterized protein LOC123398229 [Hordeum vulgare subsp. vulgare]
MKIGKTTEILKKVAAMCKSKTTRLLILASLQRRRMAARPMVANMIHTLTRTDRERVDYRKAFALDTIDKRPVIVHGGDFAANLSHQLEMLGQDDGRGACHGDWTVHSLFNNDHVNYCYTNDDGDDDDDNDGDDELLDVCDQDDDDDLSVMDVIRSKREVEGLEFNMEEEIDQAADMFIKRFRQRLNNGF